MNVKLAALLSVVIALSACAPAASLGGDVGLARADVARASADPADAVRAGTAVDAFGLDLYRAIAAGKTNLVFSPASITLALAMARAGARGATASEMDAVMHGAAADDHTGWLNALDQALATRSGTFKDESGKDAAITLRIANVPFAQQGMPLEKPYLEALAERFGGGLRLVDFETQTEQARALINGWVDAQTEHRIVPDDLAAFESTLTADSFAAITGALSDTEVALALPKFGIETKTDLASTLAALGMPSAFDDRADFSGITTAEQLEISDVIHQANIDVDEKGTEAAAATAVVMRATAMPAEPVTLRVDRPFLFALRDVPTGSILFLGRVGDPSIAR
jgi:serine protease inhibitor